MRFYRNMSVFNVSGVVQQRAAHEVVCRRHDARGEALGRVGVLGAAHLLHLVVPVLLQQQLIGDRQPGGGGPAGSQQRQPGGGGPAGILFVL